MPAVCPRSYADCEKLYNTHCRELANDAFQRYCLNILERLYLSGEEYTGNTGKGYKPYISSESDDVEVLVSESIPRNVTSDQIYYWIKDALRRTPHFAYCD